jgi:flagellar basal body-associated protein FliL
MKKEPAYEFDEPLTPELASDAEGKTQKLKKLLIFIAPIILLITAGTYFFFFVIKAPKITDVVETQQTNTKEKATLTPTTYFDMDPITVGLSPSGAKREYLRLTLTIKLNNTQESNVLMSFMPAVKDSLVTFLRSLRSTDFNSSGSTIYLKEELTKRINKIVAPVVIKEVLFQEITVN